MLFKSIDSQNLELPLLTRRTGIPQYLSPRDKTFTGEPRVMLPQIASAVRSCAQHGLEVVYSADTIRHCQQRGVCQINTPSQTLDSFPTGTAHTVHTPPFSAGLQHVARFGTALGQFHIRIVAYHLVLIVLLRSEHKQGDRTRILTLTRVRITMTDSNTSFTGMISDVSLAAVRVSISAFNAAVVAE